MDLNLLNVFLVLSETRSVIKTAESLHLTQSAVSHALNRLRAALDDRLFIPSRKGLIPTARAEAMLGPIRDALHLIDTTVSSADAFAPGTSTRHFRIGVNNYAESWLTPRLVDHIAREAPGLTVEWLPIGGMASVDSLLESHKLDIVVDSVPYEDNRLCSERIVDLQLTSLVRRDIFELLGSDLALVWRQVRHVVYRVGASEHQTFDSVARKAGFKRHIAAMVPSAHSMMAIAAKSGYVCTVPTQLADQFAAQYGLQILGLPFTSPSQPIYLAWHELSSSDAGTNWLREQVHQLLSEPANQSGG